MNLLFRTPISILPPHSAGPRRDFAARNFATRGLALLLFVPLATLGGCSRTSAPTAQDSTAAAAGSTPARAGQVQSEQAPSTPGSSWLDVLQRWWEVASQSRTSDAGVTATPTPIPAAPGEPTRSEIAALAVKHSAWKLADALEQNRIESVNFEAIQGRAALAGGTLAAPSFDVVLADSGAAAESASGQPDKQRSTLPPPAFASPNSAASAASPDTIVLNLATWQDEARELQEDSLGDFLRSVAARQSDWQRDYRQILEIALGENVEAAAERIPTTLALVMPAPEMQLEMTNLRLKLLSNVFSTPEERDATRDRLRDLMTQWREKLHEQEVARAAELKRLRIEEPAQLRASGLTRIAEEIELIRRAQREAQAAIIAEHRARLAEDFGPEQTQLALTIPGGVSIAPGVLQPSPIEISAPVAPGHNGNEAIPVIGNLSFMRTNRRAATSVSGFNGVAASTAAVRNARAEQIRALRQLAWRDATRQARMAKRLGY